MISIQRQIEAAGAFLKGRGLDFFPVIFYLCPKEVLHLIAAYGAPNRFSYWSFGQRHQRIKRLAKLNVLNFLELIVLSNPCRAYLATENPDVVKIAVSAHAFGHSDFFKNNVHLASLDRSFFESLAIHRDCLEDMVAQHGLDKVEKTLDAALSLKNHIDILGYIYQHNLSLASWQKSIIGMLIKEREFFLTLRETRIINEGWATYWHSKIRELFVKKGQALLEFTKFQSGLLAADAFQINPYLIGSRIFNNIFERFGQDKAFAVRKYDNDSSFLQTYLTEELIQELRLVDYQNPLEDNSKSVKHQLLNSLLNGGYPIIKLKKDDVVNSGLCLVHCFDGRELDLQYMEGTLRQIFYLWGGAVQLETIIDGTRIRFSYDFAGLRNSIF